MVSEQDVIDQGSNENIRLCCNLCERTESRKAGWHGYLLRIDRCRQNCVMYSTSTGPVTWEDQEGVGETSYEAGQVS